jgi:hypothetical protein
MNIDTVCPPPILSIKELNPIDSAQFSAQFRKAIALRLDVLVIFSESFLSRYNSKFVSTIQMLSEDNTNFHQCKLNFIEAFIYEFNEEDREYFLDRFFEKFDPMHEVIQIEHASFEKKDFLWEHTLRYFLESYLSLPASSLSLSQIYKSKLSEADLEKRFDEGVDLLFDFAVERNNSIGIRILLATFLARLIILLEQEKELNKTPENLFSSLMFIFQELYFYFLMLSPPHSPAHSLPELFSISQKDLKLLNREKIKKTFINQLIGFFEKSSISPDKIEKIKVVFQDFDPLKHLGLEEG